MKKALLPLALAATALSFSAHAKEAGRFAVTAGFAGQQHGGDTLGTVPLTDYPVGSHLEKDTDSNGASLGLSWFVTPQFALELWGAGKFDARTEIDVPRNGLDVEVLRYETRPLALSAQYHFTQLGDRFTPMLGLGMHRTAVSGVVANRDIPEVAGLKIGNGTGVAATVGLDVALTQRLFARGDVRYLKWTSDVTRTGSVLKQDADMHALIYGVSIGMRF